MITPFQKQVSKAKPRTAVFPMLQKKVKSNPIQQMTGRVGGKMTTAYRTQPLSAQFSRLSPAGKPNRPSPIDAMKSWLSASTSPQISQMFANALGWQNNNPFNRSLPQNMTKQVMQRRR